MITGHNFFSITIIIMITGFQKMWLRLWLWLQCNRLKIVIDDYDYNWPQPWPLHISRQTVPQKSQYFVRHFTQCCIEAVDSAPIKYPNSCQSQSRTVADPVVGCSYGCVTSQDTSADFTCYPLVTGPVDLCAISTPFWRIELIVHIAISVLPGTDLHLSQMKHVHLIILFRDPVLSISGQNKNDCNFHRKCLWWHSSHELWEWVWIICES